MLVIGGGAAALESNNHSVCASGLGQLSQALSQSAQQQCTIDNLIFYGGIILAVVGGIVLLAALIVSAVRGQPQSLPPGWYPDDRGTMRWWGGAGGYEASPPPSQAVTQTGPSPRGLGNAELGMLTLFLGPLMIPFAWYSGWITNRGRWTWTLVGCAYAIVVIVILAAHFQASGT